MRVLLLPLLFISIGGLVVFLVGLFKLIQRRYESLLLEDGRH